MFQYECVCVCVCEVFHISIYQSIRATTTRLFKKNRNKNKEQEQEHKQEQEQEQEHTSAGTTVSPEFRSDSTICVATETGRYTCKSGARSVSNAVSSWARVAVVGFRVGCACDVSVSVSVRVSVRVRK